MTRFSDTLLRLCRLPQMVLRQRRLRQGNGFTLVEMLAVIAIIGILGAAIGIALSGSGSSTAALGNAQRMVSSIFQAARTNAVMKGQETAVIIYRDGGADREKALRFIGIVYRDGSGWKPLNRGTYLPKGIYFVPPNNYFSEAQSSGNSGTTASISFPITTASSDQWYAYTFDKNGNLSAGSTYLLFAPSTPKVVGQNIEIEKEIPINQMGGIAIRKTGGVLMVDTLSDSIYNALSSQINSMDRE